MNVIKATIYAVKMESLGPMTHLPSEKSEEQDGYAIIQLNQHIFIISDCAPNPRELGIKYQRQAEECDTKPSEVHEGKYDIVYPLSFQLPNGVEHLVVKGKYGVDDPASHFCNYILSELSPLEREQFKEGRLEQIAKMTGSES
jgi:hypothetical protein